MKIRLSCGGEVNLDTSLDKDKPVTCSNGCSHAISEVGSVVKGSLERDMRFFYVKLAPIFLLLACCGLYILYNIFQVEFLKHATVEVSGYNLRLSDIGFAAS